MLSSATLVKMQSSVCWNLEQNQAKIPSGGFMVEMNGVYVGHKRCDLTHGPSGTHIQTDAPKDNGGEGAAFSPTDLVGAALGSCMITTMAIGAEKESLKLRMMTDYPSTKQP